MEESTAAPTKKEKKRIDFSRPLQAMEQLNRDSKLEWFLFERFDMLDMVKSYSYRMENVPPPASFALVLNQAVNQLAQFIKDDGTRSSYYPIFSLARGHFMTNFSDEKMIVNLQSSHYFELSELVKGADSPHHQVDNLAATLKFIRDNKKLVDFTKVWDTKKKPAIEFVTDVYTYNLVFSSNSSRGIFFIPMDTERTLSVGMLVCDRDLHNGSSSSEEERKRREKETALIEHSICQLVKINANEMLKQCGTSPITDFSELTL